MIITRGTTLTASNDMCLIPGSKVVIDEDATVNLGGNVYVYDLDDWNGFAYTYQRICYPFRPTSHYTQTSDWTKKDNMEDAKILVNGKLNITGNLYTTNGGADICSSNYGEIYLSKITKPSTTYQASNDLGSKKGISVNAAQLHNGDGSYVKTAEAASGTTYYYDPNGGKWATTEPASPSFSQSGNHVKLDKSYLLTSGVSDKFANNLKNFATGKNVLSADLTNATGTFDVAAMRKAIGATDDNNVLLYAPSNEAKANNVIVNGTAANLVIADKQPIDVPTAFTATKVSYNRATSNYKWGTICLPFALTSNDNIQYYELESVKGNTMTLTKVDKVEANQPAIYSLTNNGSNLSIGGDNVAVAAKVTNDVNKGTFTLKGVQTEVKKLDANSTNYYYIAQDKFWQPTTNSVIVRPQRAYFETTASSTSAKVLSIVDGETTGISSAETSEPTIVGIYTVGGTKIDNLEKGINIVKMSDGTTKKIILK